MTRTAPVALRREVGDDRSRRPSAQRGSSSMPRARRGPRAMAAPSSVPPTPANGSRTSSPGAAEELDEPGHQPRRLVGAVRLARGVPELGRVGRRQDRLREVEPLLAGQLVELVGGVRGAAAVGHALQRSRAPGRPARNAGSGCPGDADLECRDAGHVHERAVRGARGRVRQARVRAPVGDCRRRRRRCCSMARPGSGRRGSSTRPSAGSTRSRSR